MKLHWYKRFPESALAGMKPLTLEERGAYNTVLDLIYFLGGELDDDDQFIAGWCSCDVRIWRRIKVRLLALDKVYIAGGKLCNSRADEVLAKATAKVASNSYAGQQSALIKAAKSAAKRSKINGLPPTNVATNGQHTPQPYLEPRINNLTVSTSASDAERASASPYGPPLAQLPDIAKWRPRLEAFKPWIGERPWKPEWGLPPDSAGRNGLIPPQMLSAWKATYAAEMAAFKAGRAA